MSDVKWVKLMVDMFDNRKIRHLRRLPEGNNIVLIWVMLLTMAGRCNAGGMIFLTENIPYNAKMLADELGFEESTVRLALEALERLNMISTAGDLLMISGWQEHQNIEGMEKIREQNRLRQKKWYDKQKALPNVSPNVTLTQPNATEEDKEEEREEEGEGDKENTGLPPAPPVPPKPTPKAPERHKHGANGWVLLTDDQYSRLLNDFGPTELKRCIDYVDESAAISKNRNEWKDWNLVIRKCHREQWYVRPVKQGRKDNGFQTSNPFLEMLQEERRL